MAEASTNEDNTTVLDIFSSRWNAAYKLAASAILNGFARVNSHHATYQIN
jgi:hypothetical protein